MIDSFQGPYLFLSNFAPSPIQYRGYTAATVEHAYQAAKTDNHDLFRTIITVSTPGKAKRMGRSLIPRPDWERVKLTVMRELLNLKFAHGSKLAQQLLDTGDAILIEGNTWGDTFWGQCDGVGQNQLGNMLMNRRIVLHERIRRAR